jgi:hypothetical protein
VHHGRAGGVPVQAEKALELGEHFGAECCGGLDLDREGAALELADQVYFEAGLVAIEV